MDQAEKPAHEKPTYTEEEKLWGWRLFCAMAFTPASSLVTSPFPPSGHPIAFVLMLVVGLSYALWTLVHDRDRRLALLLFLCTLAIVSTSYPLPLPEPVQWLLGVGIMGTATYLFFHPHENSPLAMNATLGKVLTFSLLLSVLLAPIIQRMLIEPPERSLFS